MEDRGYLLLKNGEKEYFPEGITILSGYNDREDIIEVKIPTSVRFIDRWAFESCENLKMVYFCDIDAINLTYIGERAFYCCNSLEVFPMPISVVSVDEEAFVDTGLKRVNFVHSRLRTLGQSAFMGCSKLTEVQLSNDINIIPSDCFADCGNLTYVTGGHIRYVDYNAFLYCNNLTKGLGLANGVVIASGNDILKRIYPHLNK